MSDKYWVYRPLLDLIGYTEGTDRGRGYNETLAYGAYTGGPVNLIGMTLKQVDELQGRMLAHPKNKWKSSAVGRYQIVRTTRRTIQKALRIPATARFDVEMQDRMACYLLGQRGIDKYLAGRLSEDTLLDNLAREWASLPTSKGKGFYGGQHAAVDPSRVRAVLAVVRERHQQGQPVREVEKPVVPVSVDQKVEQKTSLWSWVSGLFSSGALGLGWLAGMDWQAIVAIGGVVLVFLVVIFLMRRQIIAGVKEIREGLA